MFADVSQFCKLKLHFTWASFFENCRAAFLAVCCQMSLLLFVSAAPLIASLFGLSLVGISMAILGLC
jgi:hypothetical protein